MLNRTCLVLSVAFAAAAFSTPARAQTTSYAFSRFAGVPTVAGSNDGTNFAPQFNVPLAVAVDSSGNVYVADTANHTVRKISAAGVTTTLAGIVDNPGAVEGGPTVARFNLPSGVWVDAAGNVFVADTNNQTIRRITAAGVVSTFAGFAGTGGSTDGAGAAARFRSPLGLAGDSAGNVYVADSGNHTIRKITPAGVVSTLAGSGAPGANDGTGANASFRNPNGVAVDSAGNVYVADSGNHTIRRVTASGVVTTLAGVAGATGASNGTGSAARFDDPRGVAVDGSGVIFVADAGNNLIRRVTGSGETSTFAGAVGNDRSVDGQGTAARFQNPNSIVIDSSGTLFVADTTNQTIRRISSGGAVTTFAGSPRSTGSNNGTGSAALFAYPTSVVMDSGKNFYLSDTDNHTIRKISPSGIVTTFAGAAGQSGLVNGTGGAARFYSPTGIAVDSADNLYVADTANRTIRKITPAGVVTTVAGGGTTFLNPTGIAVDSAGNIYVSDITFSVIFRVTPAGAVSVFAGSSGLIGFTDGTGTAARFQFPIGLMFDPAGGGSILVADTGNNAIRRMTLGGAVSTVANSQGLRGSLDGAAAAARFDRPYALTTDSGGNIFIADFGNSTIRQITSGGTVLTIGGTAGVYGRDDGVASVAQFNEPSGIAVDNATGTLYIVDQGNHTIRIGTRTGQTSIGTQPTSQTVAAGQTVTFNVSAFGSGLSYQWFKNGTAISGATGTSYTIPSVQPSDVGTYTVRVTGSTGTVDSLPATLSIGTGGGNGGGGGGGGGGGAIASRLVNLSILTDIASAGESFTMGYVVGGAGTSGSKPVLIRAAGPTLGAAPFNIPGALADPKLELFAGQTKTGENDNWGGTQALSTAFASVGAFAYVSGTSLDAAVQTNIAAGDNSVRVSATGTGTGTVIAELYDSTPIASMTTTSPRLVNVSVLKNLGTGLTAGFVIDGTAAKRVLIRAVGPTIGGAPFNVPGAVADPQLTLFSAQTAIGANDNWGGTAELTAAFAQVGAFALPAGSRDAAIISTLQPGSYTVQVSGVGGTTGVAIVEVYEVP